MTEIDYHKHYEKYKETYKAYYKNNRDNILAEQKNYYKFNRTLLKEKQKRNYNQNQKQLKQYQTDYENNKCHSYTARNRIMKLREERIQKRREQFFNSQC